MMKHEQNFNKMDVRTLKTDVLEQVMLQCYKHQQFKTSAAVKKINRGHYSERSITNYLDLTKSYFTRGVKYPRVSSRIYDLLDKFKASHVAILTPTESERYKPLSPTIKVHPQADKLVKQIQKINFPKYGVKYENTIKVFDNKDFCLGYKECFEVFNKDKKADLIKVNYELVEEKQNGTN